MSEDDGGKKYHDPIPTVDVILRRPGDPTEILIETRGRDPFKGFYALPGGHVDYGETVEAAALRELHEECGVSATLSEIFGVYSDPNRDPRGQRITTVFLADYKGGEAKGADDASSAEWADLEQLLQSKERLAFDHSKILSDYSRSLEGKRNETFWSSK